MRSRPFTSPYRQAGLSTCVSHYDYGRTRTSIADDEAVSLVESDPETDRLLPHRQCRHRVRIQGRLAIVRTVSVPNSRQVKNGSPIAHMNISRRGSYKSEVKRDEGDYVGERDEQFRGYGIGGAGNIRM